MPAFNNQVKMLVNYLNKLLNHKHYFKIYNPSAPYAFYLTCFA